MRKETNMSERRNRVPRSIALKEPMMRTKTQVERVPAISVRIVPIPRWLTCACCCPFIFSFAASL